MMGNTGDGSLQWRTGLKKGLSSPILLLSTRSQDWKWVAEPLHSSGQDQRSNATLELDAKITGHVWIRHGVLQVICGNGSEHRKAGHPLKHLQDPSQTPSRSLPIGGQQTADRAGVSHRISRKTGYVLSVEEMGLFCFLFCFSRKHCLLVLNWFAENETFFPIKDF